VKLKNAPRTLHQTAKRCFGSYSSTEDTELKDEKKQLVVIYVLVFSPCSAQRLCAPGGRSL